MKRQFDCLLFIHVHVNYFQISIATFHFAVYSFMVEGAENMSYLPKPCPSHWWLSLSWSNSSEGSLTWTFYNYVNSYAFYDVHICCAFSSKAVFENFAFHYDLCTVCVDYVLSITDIVTKCYSCSGPNTWCKLCVCVK